MTVAHESSEYFSEDPHESGLPNLGSIEVGQDQQECMRCAHCPLQQHVAIEKVNLTAQPSTAETKAILSSLNNFAKGVRDSCYSEDGPIVTERKYPSGKVVIQLDCASNLGHLHPKKITRSKSRK
jgi:hypothetical protein